MHIAEGALNISAAGTAVLCAGWAVTVAGTAIGLRRMDYDRIPQVAMLSSAFFVVSLVVVPLGVTSDHLVLSGLIGLVLGWAAFPAFLVALALQALLFSWGGPTTLGVNTLVMAAPAVVCHYLFRRAVRARSERATFAAGFAAGALGVLLGALLSAAALVTAGREFVGLACVALLGHLLIMAAEGLVTGAAVVFLRKVRPGLLDAPLMAAR